MCKLSCIQRDYSWIPCTCICENSECLNSIVDASVIECDEIITVLDGVTTK